MPTFQIEPSSGASSRCSGLGSDSGRLQRREFKIIVVAPAPHKNMLFAFQKWEGRVIFKHWLENKQIQQYCSSPEAFGSSEKGEAKGIAVLKLEEK